jgi:hypothetical protein
MSRAHFFCVFVVMLPECACAYVGVGWPKLLADIAADVQRCVADTLLQLTLQIGS